jgi:hypothetical protein
MKMSQLVPSSQLWLCSTRVDSEGDRPTLYDEIIFGHGGIGIGTTISTSMSKSQSLPSQLGVCREVTLISPPSPGMQPAYPDVTLTRPPRMFGHGGIGIGTTMSMSISNSHAPLGSPHGGGFGVTVTVPPSPGIQPS